MKLPSTRKEPLKLPRSSKGPTNLRSLQRPSICTPNRLQKIADSYAHNALYFFFKKKNYFTITPSSWTINKLLHFDRPPIDYKDILIYILTIPYCVKLYLCGLRSKQQGSAKKVGEEIPLLNQLWKQLLESSFQQLHLCQLFFSHIYERRCQIILGPV